MRKTKAAALAAPKLWLVFDMDQKTNENPKGSTDTPKINAITGFGLKLCVSPSDIGRTKKKINHITLNQKTPKDIGRTIFRKLFFLLVSE
jgi:hypothetical protein